MERTPAACAMDWSIQLQKDLRSDIPGKSIDALQEIGRRLQRWNKDPKLTFAEHTMFGLFPEEDKLFLNAILLCLADAFSSGDKHTKECVVRIFMKIKRRGNRDAEGIFSKEMFENQLELLTRVKEVFDEGDTEERALSLRLFGCWAYFAKDCPDVRYIALSSLVTGDVLEVKAAYFAAGYLSETSDDFAVVFLEMLRTTVSSQESSEDIKLAAGRAFAKLWCSFSIAENAYKLGLKLLMDSSEDDFSATMLISLSKIASRWMLLVPTQILLINFSIIPCMEIPELFQKLFVVVKNMLKSSVQSNRVFAVNVLADLSGKVLGRQDMWSGGSGCTLASQVISFILDQVISLVTPLIGNNMADFAVEFEMIDKESEKTVLSNPHMTVYVSNGKTLVESNIILTMSKIMAICLENLEYTAGLKSLSWFSTSEKQIQLFFLSGQGTCIIPGGSGLRERCQCIEDPKLQFPKMFLTLRAKVLKKVADMMQLLDSVSSIQGGTGIMPYEKKLAEESDMLLTSFMGMDRQSVMSVSTLALNCSVMAFTAGFAFLVPDWCSSEIYKVSKSRYLDETLHALLIEDLLGRFKHIGFSPDIDTSLLVVLDVGCGTGILSIFCAQAGAKRVYAVDASNIAIQIMLGWSSPNEILAYCLLLRANEVIKANNLSDTVIVLHGRVEDVEIDEKVDVIVSEWMGYMLLYESMLGSVITARDRWLKPGGLILPSYATLYMAPVSYPERYSESVDFWRNVYGIDMSAMMPLAKQCAFEEPSVEMISGENVLTWPHVVKHVDCSTLTIEELQTVSTRFTFKSMMRAPFHGFAFWFDVEFGTSSVNTSKSNNAQPALLAAPDDTATEADKTKKRANPSEGLVLSTAPEAPPTHWQQTLIYFYDPIEVEQDQVIEGSVTLTQSLENARFMNVHLEYSSGGRFLDGSKGGFVVHIAQAKEKGDIDGRAMLLYH
ncbi:hypothetical protein SASPL_130678 [Salvia splendens]|uniref:Protein arginine N-methyltransferase 6 n=1 Tax=Salvia splendens TaxID=180675 RepID=A0A8X8ZK60_SALSN|nr:hypothetical protein SASPL_130678 [Salvia splendens]